MRPIGETSLCDYFNIFIVEIPSFSLYGHPDWLSQCEVSLEQDKISVIPGGYFMAILTGLTWSKYSQNNKIGHENIHGKYCQTIEMQNFPTMRPRALFI